MNTQENRTTVLLSYEERVVREENIKDVIRERMQKGAAAPGEKSSFFKSSFSGLVKFSTDEGVPGWELSPEQSARDSGHGERKGRGGKWTPLSSQVR